MWIYKLHTTMHEELNCHKHIRPTVILVGLILYTQKQNKNSNNIILAMYIKQVPL